MGGSDTKRAAAKRTMTDQLFCISRRQDDKKKSQIATRELDAGKNFVRMVKTWDRLPKER